MNRLAVGEEPVLRTTRLDDTAAVKSGSRGREREKEAKIGTGVWMWWTDGTCLNDGHVEATAEC
jgi:hypothetical protein